MSNGQTRVDWRSVLLDGAVETLIDVALQEDLGTGDATTQAVFRGPEPVEASIGARDATVVCGLPIVETILKRFDPDARVEPRFAEGTRVEAGSVIATVEADLRFVLSTERVILNFLMRTCGVATAARRAVEALPPGCRAKVFDTRKTMPGWRLLDKTAVAVGGAENHRQGLYDAMMIKDNHIAAAGSLTAAVQAARAWAGDRLTLEVEVDTLEQLDEALAAAPDIILLDNFSLEELRTAVKRCAGAIPLEASGGVNLQSLPDIARTGVDRISMGSLTHSALPADLGMDFP
jgi:nicotinate-nucleotide pyrophosphorylase (carboxylating)